MSFEFDRQSLVEIFVTEASEALDMLTKAFYPFDGATPTPAQLQTQYAWAHKIRGASGLYGYEGLATMGALLESTLEEALSIESSLWPKTLETLRGMVVSFRAQLKVVANGGIEDQKVSAQWKSKVAELFLLPPAIQSESAALASDYLVPTLDADVLSYFPQEADEYLHTIESLLHRLRIDSKDGETINALYRTVHTLKGSAYTIGFEVVGDVAHPIEDYLIAVREERASLSLDVLGAIGRGIEVIRRLMRLESGNAAQLQIDVPDVIHALAKIRSEEQISPPVPAAGETAAVVHPATDVVVRPGESFESVMESPAGSSALTDEYLLPALDAEVLSYFDPEAQEYLEALEAQLLRLEKEQHNPEVVDKLFRTAHTLKGSAYTVGFQSIGDLTHYIEDFMGAVRDGRIKTLPWHTDVLLRSVDVVRLLMRRDPMSLDLLRQRFAVAIQRLRQIDQPAAAQATEFGPAAALIEEPAGPELLDQQEITPTKASEGKTAEDREVVRVSRDRLERLLNLVGELVIGRGRLEQRLCTLEQLSQQVLACKGQLVESVRLFEEKHAFTLPTAASKPADVLTQGFTGFSDFGSLEFDKYDDFNILARRISEVTADISESMTQLTGSIRRSHEDMSHLSQLTLGMRDEIARARMVPIGTPFTRFHRATREMARTTGKEVMLVTSGEHTEVDTVVVERLVDPLIHLVRNAVCHGIEPPTVRMSKGKPAAGTIYLHAAHRGNAVLIEVEDDGAGLDIEKIRAKAIERGLISPEAARSIPESQIIKFIFVPGFSTADQIDDQAGRGVGMDVVKRVIESMNGHIDVESVRGVGTKFTLSLPLTLLIATALMVRVGNERYGIPLPAVREVIMLTSQTLQRMGERSVLYIGDEAIEVLPLQQLLDRKAAAVEIGKPVVIVRTAAGMIGIMVDELLGRQEIVVKPLGSLKSLDRSSFGGATIDPEGRVILVLDPVRLLAHEADTASIPELSADTMAATDSLIPCSELPQSKVSEQSLLLIDDSLSVRKFVGRMLESAGYEVDTAVDGEEGLRKASTNNYQLIITDLEMPKLNGYEVIQGLRSRAQTQQTPVIVMTTRAGDKHRQMALNIGASSYIAKPVEERALIQEIERWIGKEAAARA